MKKSELIEDIFQSDKIKYKAVVNRMIKELFMATAEDLANGSKRVNLGNDIGLFKLKFNKGREGESFGKKWKSEDSYTISFKASKNFKKHVTDLVKLNQF